MNDIATHTKEIALNIWDSKKEYIKYARFLGLKYRGTLPEWEDCHDLLNDTITDIIGSILDNKPSAFDSRKSPLNFFVKRRMQSIYQDQQRHNQGVRQAEINNDIERSENNQTLNYSGRKVSLINNPIKRFNDSYHQLILTTNKPHKASIGDTINITGLVGISNITKDRLGHKLGSDIFVSEILNGNNFVINLNFKHDINETGVGGENCFIFIKNTPFAFKKDNTYEILSGELEETKILDQMEIDKLWQLCFQKLNRKQQAVYKLNQMRNIEGINLGEKKTEPKLRNDGVSLSNGDIYFPLNEIVNQKRTATKDILVFKIYLDGKWVDKYEQDNINKPLDTNTIANILNWPAGTVSYLLAGAKKSLGKCLGAAEYV